MSPDAYALLARCTSTAVYVRSHDRLQHVVDALIDAKLATLWGKRLEPTAAGVDALAGMAR